MSATRRRKLQSGFGRRTRVGSENEEQRVRRFQVGGDAVEIDGVDHIGAGDQRNPVLVQRRRGDQLRARQSRRQRVPRVAGVERDRGLEELRVLPGLRNALRPRAGGDRAAEAAGRGERQLDARRHPGPQAIADQPGQLQHRAAFARGREIPLVGDAFLVEGQHVGNHRPGIEQRQRRIRWIAGGELSQRHHRLRAIARRRRHRQRKAGQPRHHRLEEGGVGANAIAERRESRRG